MKIFLFLALLWPSINFATGKSDFIVDNKNGYWSITHIASKQEPLSALSSLYYVNTQVLANVNNLGLESTVYVNQPVIIPLIETNYFKTGGISANKKGYSPLYFIVNVEDNTESICKKFSLATSSFLKWNPELKNDGGITTEKVIIGWLKFGEEYKESPESVVAVTPMNKPRSGFVSKPLPEKKLSVAKMKTEDKHVKSESKKVELPETRNTEKETVKTVTKVPTKTLAKAPVKLEPKMQAKTGSKTLVKPEPKTASRTTVKPDVKISPSSTQYKTWVSKSPSAKPSRITQAKEKSKLGIQLSAFIARIKNKFKTAPQHESTGSKEVIAKSESKVSKQRKVIIDKPTEKGTSKISATHQEPKSMKGIWDRLVNGKKPEEASKITKPVAPTIQPSTRVAPKNNVLYEKQQALLAKKTTTPYKTTAPAPLTKVNSSASTLKVKEKRKNSEPVKIKDSIVNNIPDTSVAVSSIPIHSTPEEPIDPTIRHEIKKLSLSKSKTGKCSFFFSGPGKGQFYVFTNLAIKGEIIKITNTQNGRYVMAEVIGSLPNADINKGILIKLSDNAKLPLGQTHISFNAKVNY